MRLTKNMRLAFVNAVMDDVPRIDYREQMQKVAFDAALLKMPSAVLAAYKKHPSFFNPSLYRVDDVGYFSLPIPEDMALGAEAIAEIRRLDRLNDAQGEARSELKQKIEGAANACSTLKALKDMLPEFAKYLPKDETAACRTLPVVQNVVADFVRAGWPKGGKK